MEIRRPLLQSLVLALVLLLSSSHFCAAFAAGPETAGEQRPVAPKKDRPVARGWSTPKKIWVLRGAVAGFIMGNALINYERRGGPDFKFTDDGWFELDAPNAGADKSGHAFSTYLFSRTFSAVYRHFGLDDRSADWQGPLTAWGAMFLAELHDVFQGFGFSYKDVVANSTGATLAYLEEHYDTLNGLMDYRIEYIPSEGFLKSDDADFLTDYSGMKHLLVFKPGGIKTFSSGPLSYLELHAGYFTKGTAYEGFSGEAGKSRNLYAGVSLNFSWLLDKAAGHTAKFKKPLHAASVILEYYQPPYVSADSINKLD